MRSRFPQALLMVMVLLASHLVPLVHAATSCCDGSHQYPAVIAVEPAPPACGEVCCGSQTESAATNAGEAPADDKGRPSGSEPCDGDCACTLCRAASTNSIVLRHALSWFGQSDITHAQVSDHGRFNSRDQRFDLLRPPQLG